MARVVDRTFAVELASPAHDVAAEVLTMPGVNHELLPYVRMTYPRRARRMVISEAPVGEVLFQSWLLGFGVFPFDRHALKLESVTAGEGFVEESTSWLQRRWRHERRIWPLPGGACRVEDHLVVESRIPFIAPLVGLIVAAIFHHRHRRLTRHFGRR